MIQHTEAQDQEAMRFSLVKMIGCMAEKLNNRGYTKLTNSIHEN